MQREDQTDHGNGGPGTNSSESAVNHLSKSVVRDTEGAAKQKPHATFCGSRERATAPGDPVVLEKCHVTATRRLPTLTLRMVLWAAGGEIPPADPAMSFQDQCDRG